MNMSRYAVLLVLLVLILMTPAAFAQATPCHGDPICYGTPVPQGTPEQPFGADGRLNPDAGEYYTLFCAGDRLQIWRGTPEGQQITSVAIADLLPMNISGQLSIGQNMVIVRQSDDIFEVYGSSGNRAPEPGSKTFSMAQCIARNGGEPAAASSSASNQSGSPVAQPSATAQIAPQTPRNPLAALIGDTSSLWIFTLMDWAGQLCGVPVFGIALALPLLRRRRSKLK